MIEHFVEHNEAIENGREARAQELEVEIDDLLDEKAQIEKWAAVGSA